MKFNYQGVTWELKHPQASADMLGLIPAFFSASDPRSAVEQANANYAHGGGWHDFHGFTLEANGDLSYPGDPPMRLIAEGKLRDEILRFNDCSWFSVQQPDGSYRVSRMD